MRRISANRQVMPSSTSPALVMVTPEPVSASPLSERIMSAP